MPHELNGISERIPEEYRATFSHLSGEVLHIREKWHQYVGLFGYSQARIDLLNDAGRLFVWILHNLLVDDLILSLSRLLDRSESFDKTARAKVPNLSFEYLNARLNRCGDAQLAIRLKTLLEKTKAAAGALQEHRHKRIAHNDRRVAIAEEDLLPPVSRGLIEKTIANAEEFLAEFERSFTNVKIKIDFVDAGNGWETLLTRLAKARAYDRLLEQGRIQLPEDDWYKLANVEGLG